MIKKARNAIERFGMLRGGERVLVAVSGGPDSLVLLDLLCRLRESYGLELEVIHIDHGLREESSRESNYVRAVADHYGLPFYGDRVEVRVDSGRRRLSPEEAARIARYTALERRLEAAGFDCIALGHHADDRVETFLLRLVAGTGPWGLTSIPPMRYPYIRPLISVWRREITDYATHLPFVPLQDPSNWDLSIPRNRVRHILLPLLEEKFNPATGEAIYRYIEMLEAERERGEGTRRVFSYGKLAEEGVRIDYFRELTLAEQRELIWYLVRSRGLEPSFQLVEDVRTKIFGGKSGSLLHLPGGWVALRDYERVRLLVRESLEARDRDRVVEIAGKGEFSLPDFGIGMVLRCEPRLPDWRAQILRGPWKASFDLQLISFPLELRHIRPGDRFHPLGAPGRRKLQDFLVDLKVPRLERSRVMVLTSKGEIVWVLGHRIDDRFKVTDATSRILQVEVEFRG